MTTEIFLIIVTFCVGQNPVSTSSMGAESTRHNQVKCIDNVSHCYDKITPAIMNGVSEVKSCMKMELEPQVQHDRNEGPK